MKEQSLHNAHARNPYWDIVKAIAMILVVAGHALTLVYGENEDCYRTFLWKFIYSMHMPLFMIVSGYFFQYSLRKNACSIIRKRFVQLLLPIIVISIADYFINYFHPPVRWPETFIDLYARYLSSLWFLRALFYCSVIVLAGNKVFKDSPLFYTIVIILSILIPEKFHSDGTQAMIPFFIFGYYFNTYNLERVFLNKKKPVFIITSVTYLLLLFFMNSDAVWYFNGVSIFNGKLPIGLHLIYDVFRMIIGIVGSLFVLQLTEILYRCSRNCPVCSHLAQIGMHTLWIYIIHSYMLRLFKPYSPFTGSSLTQYLLVFLLTLILLYSSYCIIVCFNSLKRLVKKEASPSSENPVLS